MQSLLIFEMGPYRCAVDMGLVSGIESCESVLMHEHDKRMCHAVDTDEGELVVCNLSILFGQPAAIPNGESRRFIRLQTGEIRFGFITDQVVGNVDVEDSETRPLPPIFNGLLRNCFPKILLHDGKPVLVADPAALAQMAKDRQDALPPAENLLSPAPDEIEPAAGSIDEEFQNSPKLSKLSTEWPQPDSQQNATEDENESAAAAESIETAPRVDSGALPNDSPMQSSNGREKIEKALSCLVKLKVGERLFHTGLTAGPEPIQSEPVFEQSNGWERIEKALSGLVKLKIRERWLTAESTTE